MKLSDRLSMIVGLARETEVAADVGCDHAHISIELLERGIAKRCIATDIIPGPLEKASENIERYGAKNIELRQCDGVSGLKPGEAGLIIVAGMGGRVMSDIIKKGKEVFLSAQQAIFQPQSEFGLVRHALEDIGMVIDRESICREGNKYYRALSSIANKDSDYAGNNFFPYNNEFMYEYGRILLDEKNELFISYLKKRYERTGKIKEKIESTGVVQTVDNDNDVELQLVTDALKYMNLL